MIPLMPMPQLPNMPFYCPVDTVPVGTVIAFAGQVTNTNNSSPPDYTSQVEAWGWILCDGRTLKICEYPELFNVIGFTYAKQGDSKDLPTDPEKAKEALFRLPDYSGYFLRGVDESGNIDPGKRELLDGTANNGVGSKEDDALQIHQHDYDKISAAGKEQVLTEGEGTPTTVGSDLTGEPTNAEPPAKNTVRTSTETRPKNYAVNYLIKYAYLNRSINNLFG